MSRTRTASNALFFGTEHTVTTSARLHSNKRNGTVATCDSLDVQSWHCNLSKPRFTDERSAESPALRSF